MPAPWLPRAARAALSSLVLAHTLLALLVLVALATGSSAASVTVGCVLLLSACAAAELAVLDRAPFGLWALGRAGIGVPARMAVRAVLVVPLVVSQLASQLAADGRGRAVQVVVVVAALAVPLTAVALAALSDLQRRVRQWPVSSSGLEVGTRQPPPAAPWTGRVGRWPLDVLVLVTAVVVTATTLPVDHGGRAAALVAGIAVLVVAVPAVALGVVTRAVMAARRVDARRVTAGVEEALDRLQPDIVLYFAGPPEAVYQLAMWLPVFERLGSGEPERRAVVVLRNPATSAVVPPTSLPVVCVERGNALLELQWPASMRLACYVSNASGDIHLLRERSLRHVFIGHGDSDKTVSTGRYAKVYDEIWEAGPAGRARWRAADVGVPDEHVVEVGAPFLDLVGPTARPVAVPPGQRGGAVTIAYTPTWEGVADGADTTSLGPCGEGLVARLLELGVRIVYRPHPLAGTRDRRVGVAHARMLSMLGLAEGDATAPAPVPATAAVAAAEPSPIGHVYAPARSATLAQVLAVADGAVTDVSAALSQLLELGIPVAVTDPVGLPESVFAQRYPTSAAAYPVGPDGAGVEALVDAIGGTDPRAVVRAATRTWLFGTDHRTGARFVAAVEAALAQPLPPRRQPPRTPPPGR